MISSTRKFVKLFFLLLLLTPQVIIAHDTGDVAGGLNSGFSHPFTGFDHVVAMIAVGIWGTQLKQPAIWLLPVTFPVVMAFGAMLGVVGVPLSGIEIGIAISAVVLGGVVLFEAKPELWVAVAVYVVSHSHTG